LARFAACSTGSKIAPGHDANAESIFHDSGY
jgi:hypothetical protein